MNISANFASKLVNEDLITLVTYLNVREDALDLYGFKNDSERNLFLMLISISGIIVLWFAGLNHKYFFYSFLISLISLPFIISFLQPYQKLRVLTFLNPDRDPLGAGYQIIQSKNCSGFRWIIWKRFFTRNTKLFRIFT